MDKYEKALMLAQSAEGYSKEAEKMLIEAADELDDRALFALGSWALHGVGRAECSVPEATDYFQRAKDLGNGDAYYELAVLLENGAEDQSSCNKALIYYLMASMLGVEDSMFEAARMMFHQLAKLSEIEAELCEEMLRISERKGYFEDETGIG